MSAGDKRSKYEDLRVSMGPAGFAFYPPVDEAEVWKAKCKQYEEMITTLQKASLAMAAVVHDNGQKVVLRTGPQQMSVSRPPNKKIGVGDVVLVTNEGGIVDVLDDPPTLGNLFVVKSYSGGEDATLTGEGPGNHGAGVCKVKESMRPGLNVGDRVLVDASGSVVVKNLGKGDDVSSMAFAEDTGVTWDDVGGQEEAKRALKEAVEEPFKHSALYKLYGKRLTKGVLLHGVPGCGKTMLAKAVATSLAQLHGKEAKGGFIYVKGPELLNMFVGASEAGVRGIFDSARSFKKRNGYPAVVAIDEADAVLSKRGQHHDVSGMERTMVPQFLAEMDGMEDSGAMVLVLTNRPDDLDPAVVRDGRVDRRVFVGRPSPEDVEVIAKKALKGRLTAAKLDDLASAVREHLFEERRALYMLRSKSGKDRRLSLGSLVSGAMVVGVVERMTQLALRRHIAGQEEGIGLGDARAAVEEAFLEQKNLDHGAALAEASKSMGQDLERVDPL